jgi:hypothetical protein
MFNYALHRTSATTVSVLILLETPARRCSRGRAGQVPAPGALPGIALAAGGVGGRGDRERPQRPPLCRRRSVSP